MKIEPIRVSTRIAVTAVVVSSVLAFSIGADYGLNKGTERAVSEDKVISAGHAAKIVGSDNFVELNFRTDTVKDKKLQVEKWNAGEWLKDSKHRWELVELFYRKVEK